MSLISNFSVVFIHIPGLQVILISTCFLCSKYTVLHTWLWLSLWPQSLIAGITVQVDALDLLIIPSFIFIDGEKEIQLKIHSRFIWVFCVGNYGIWCHRNLSTNDSFMCQYPRQWRILGGPRPTSIIVCRGHTLPVQSFQSFPCSHWCNRGHSHRRVIVK